MSHLRTCSSLSGGGAWPCVSHGNTTALLETLYNNTGPMHNELVGTRGSHTCVVELHQRRRWLSWWEPDIVGSASCYDSIVLPDSSQRDLAELAIWISGPQCNKNNWLPWTSQHLSLKVPLQLAGELSVDWPLYCPPLRGDAEGEMGDYHRIQWCTHVPIGTRPLRGNGTHLPCTLVSHPHWCFQAKLLHSYDCYINRLPLPAGLACGWSDSCTNWCCFPAVGTQHR